MHRCFLRACWGLLLVGATLPAEDVAPPVAEAERSPPIRLRLCVMQLDVRKLRKYRDEVGEADELLRLYAALRLPKPAGDVGNRPTVVTPVDDLEAVERVLQDWSEKRVLTTHAEPTVVASVGASASFHDGGYYRGYFAETGSGAVLRSISLGTTVTCTPLVARPDGARCELFCGRIVADWKHSIVFGKERVPYLWHQFHYSTTTELPFDKPCLIHGHRSFLVLDERLKENEALILVTASRIVENAAGE